MKFSFLYIRWWQTYYRFNNSTFNSVVDIMSQYITPDILLVFTWLAAFSIAISPILGWSYYHPETNGLTYVN